MAPKLRWCGGAYAAQLSSRQGGLEQVARVYSAILHTASSNCSARRKKIGGGDGQRNYAKHKAKDHKTAYNLGVQSTNKSQKESRDVC